jgi:hypothetical protein
MLMSVNSIIRGGINLVRTQPRVVAIWGLLYVIVMGVLMAVLFPAMASVMEAQRLGTANAAMGMIAPPPFPQGLFATIFLFDLLYFLFLLVLFAAAVRAVVRPSDDRFAYLRLGMDELRLIGLGVIFMVAAILAEFVAILLLALIGGLLGAAIGKVGAALVAVVLGLLIMCAAIYVEVRFSLAGVLTVMQGRIVIMDSWRATRGMFWTLLGAYLLIGLAFLLVFIVIIAITNPHLLSAYASLDPRAMNAAAQEQMAGQGGFSVSMIVQMLLGAVVGTLMMAVASGAAATAALESQAGG